MKIEEIRKHLEMYKDSNLLGMDENNNRLDVEVGLVSLIVNRVPVSFSDELARKLRDWLCELYGLPEEKE